MVKKTDDPYFDIATRIIRGRLFFVELNTPDDSGISIKIKASADPYEKKITFEEVIKSTEISHQHVKRSLVSVVEWLKAFKEANGLVRMSFGWDFAKGNTSDRARIVTIPLKKMLPRMLATLKNRRNPNAPAADLLLAKYAGYGFLSQETIVQLISLQEYWQADHPKSLCETKTVVKGIEKTFYIEGLQYTRKLLSAINTLKKREAFYLRDGISRLK